jgi:hypothetical protein
MYWRDYFFYDTTNAADTYETIATAHNPNTVLQHFTVNVKHSTGITFNAKLVYVDDDGATTDIMLSEDLTLATTKTYNFLDTVNTWEWATPGTFNIPQGSYIQVKSNIINSIDVVCTTREYSQDKFTY